MFRFYDNRSVSLVQQNGEAGGGTDVTLMESTGQFVNTSNMTVQFGQHDKCDVEYISASQLQVFSPYHGKTEFVDIVISTNGQQFDLVTQPFFYVCPDSNSSYCNTILSADVCSSSCCFWSHSAYTCESRGNICFIVMSETE